MTEREQTIRDCFDVLMRLHEDLRHWDSERATELMESMPSVTADEWMAIQRGIRESMRALLLMDSSA